MAKREDKESDKTERKGFGAITGILGGLTELVERLGELAQKGEELTRGGAINLGEGLAKGKDLKAVYGFSFKTGIGGEGVKVEPFGNVRKDEDTGESVVQEIHEPITDIFEEEDHVLIVAEMPGVDAEDIELDLHGDVLTLYAEGEERKYRKEVLLPGEFSREKISVSCKNGIVKITCKK